MTSGHERSSKIIAHVFLISLFMGMVVCGLVLIFAPQRSAQAQWYLQAAQFYQTQATRDEALSAPYHAGALQAYVRAVEVDPYAPVSWDFLSQSLQAQGQSDLVDQARAIVGALEPVHSKAYLDAQ